MHRSEPRPTTRAVAGPARSRPAALARPDPARIQFVADACGASRRQTGYQSLADTSSLVGRLGALQAMSVRQPVRQLWLDGDLLKGRTRDNRTRDIARLALDYNENRKRKTRTDRIDELSRLTGAILRFLDGADTPDLYAKGHRRWAMDLLNNVQTEHRKLVEDSVAQKDDQPPVANFSELPKDQQQLVRRIWTKVVGNSGKIRITEDENYLDTVTNVPGTKRHEGFRAEALAQFARLLETETGRLLLGQIESRTSGEHVITIRPGLSEAKDGRPSSEFAASVPGGSREQLLTKFDMDNYLKNQPNRRKRVAAYKQKFESIDPSGIDDPTQKAAEIYKVRLQNPKAVGVKIGTDYFRFGSGRSSEIALTRDIADASESHLARFVDDTGSEIPVPNFVTLGHELGHSLHMMTGASLSDDDILDSLSGRLSPYATPGGLHDDWSNMEEYANINAVENNIRADLGLKKRFGHGNQVTAQTKPLGMVTNTLFSLSDSFPPQDKGKIENLLIEAGRRNANLNPADGRNFIVKAVDGMLAALPSAFSGFSAKERRDISSCLDEVKQRVASLRGSEIIEAIKLSQDALNMINAARQRIAPVQNPQNPQGQQRYWPSFETIRGFIPKFGW